MKLYQIKSWRTNETIYESHFDSLKECVEDAVKKGINFFMTKKEAEEWE